MSSKKITPSLLIKAFSLPRSLDKMFQYEVFDSDREKRLNLASKTTDDGDAHGYHHIDSLNLFTQTIYMEKVPGIFSLFRPVQI